MDAPTGGPDDTAIAAFIERWRNSSGQERVNYALFLGEFCDVLGVDRPNPARDDGVGDHYRFEFLSNTHQSIRRVAFSGCPPLRHGFPAM